MTTCVPSAPSISKIGASSAMLSALELRADQLGYVV
jgi:hypothetical protein